MSFPKTKGHVYESQSMITEFVITAGETPKRLDRFLVFREPDMSRSALKRLIEHGRIRVNAQVVKPSQKIQPGDHITMDVPPASPLVLNGEEIRLDILDEDDVVLVLNKPAGIVVHPGSGHWSDTLVNALLAHFQRSGRESLSDRARAQYGIVHRLDKETSGVMVVAKTKPSHRALVSQFEQHNITRTYEALVWGVPDKEHGVVALAIGRDDSDLKVRSSRATAPKEAVTEYRVTQRFGSKASHVLLHPQTGRTHQLRIHLASLGCPILGDPVYGDPTACRADEIQIPRTMLHARTLRFKHPTLGTVQEYAAPVPRDMQAVYRNLVDTTHASTSVALRDPSQP